MIEAIKAVLTMVAIAILIELVISSFIKPQH